MDSTLPPPPSNIASQGFTLVELAIVIVLVGLLTGAVLVGNSLFKTAHIKSVISEYNHYMTAIDVFKNKYHYYPGDLPKATSYWGEADADPTTCQTTVGTGTETCDGNGDNTFTNSAANYYELYRAWQHLSNAGLIEGRYTGVTGSGSTSHSVIDENIPASEYPGVGWSFYQWDHTAASANPNYGLDFGNVLILGAELSTDISMEPNILVEDAMVIDVKIDDGLPGKGFVIGEERGGCNDASGQYDFDSNYDTADDSALCALYFRNIF